MREALVPRRDARGSMIRTRFPWMRRVCGAAGVARAGARAAITRAPRQRLLPAQKKTAAPAAPPAIGGAQPSLLGQFGEWSAYTATPHGKKICFVLAKPASSQTNPPNRPRDPAFLFIATRPAEKVKDEVSFTIGYPFKDKSVATVEVGTTKLASIPTRTGPGSAVPPMKRAWSKLCARARTWWSRARRDAARSRPTTSRSRAWPRRSIASRRNAADATRPAIALLPATSHLC